MREIDLKIISGYLLILVVALSAATATWFSIRSNPIYVFISASIGWLSYMAAHKQLTGKPFHSVEEDIEIRGPDTWRRKGGFTVGILLAITAFPSCIVAIKSRNFPLLVFGYILFFSGYVIMHYNWFGDPI